MNDLIRAVLRRRLPSSDKSVLNVYAMHADKNGEAFPSIETLAYETGLSKATVCRALRSLVASSDLIVVNSGGGRRSTTYKIGCIEQSQCEQSHHETSHRETPAISPRDPSSLTDECAIRNELTYNKHISSTPARAIISDFDCELDFAASELMQRLRMFGSDALPLCRSAAKAYCEQNRLPPLRAPDDITALYARYSELGGVKEAVFFLKNGTFLKPESDWNLNVINQSSKHQAKAEQRAASWDRAFGVRRELDS